MKLGRVARLLLAALVVSCAEEGVEKENFTVVIATFWSNQDTQWVWVDSVHSLGPGDTMGVSGARVLCYWEGDSAAFSEDTSRPGAYWALLAVRETTLYTLSVESPVGDTVELLMMSPRPFQLLSPQSGDTLPVDSLELVWTTGGNRLFYLFVFLEAPGDTGGESDSLIYILPIWPGDQETTSLRVPVFALGGPGDYRLRLGARDTMDDENYYSQFDILWCPGELRLTLR